MVENIEQKEGIKDKIRRKISDLYQVAEALSRLGNLPKAFVKSRFESVKTKEEEKEQQKQVARHESGHLLAHILQNDIVTLAYVTNFSSQVANAMGRPDGVISTGKGQMFDKTYLGFSLKTLFGVNEVQKVDLKEDTYEEIMKQFLSQCGGLVSDYTFERRGESKKEALESIIGPREDPTSVSDENKIRLLAKELVERGNIVDIDKDEERAIQHIIEKVFSALTAFYERPNVKKVLNTIANELHSKGSIAEQKERGGINKHVLKTLQEEGITEGEFETLSQEYNELVQRLSCELKSFLNL